MHNITASGKLTIDPQICANGNHSFMGPFLHSGGFWIIHIAQTLKHEFAGVMPFTMELVNGVKTNKQAKEQKRCTIS